LPIRPIADDELTEICDLHPPDHQLSLAGDYYAVLNAGKAVNY
jgi:hypothetical protein